MDNKHAGWHQGYFVDQRQYKRMPESWKDECRRKERLLVRPSSPLGNAICKCNEPEIAEWIAERLNLAAKLESNSPKSNIESANSAEAAKPNTDYAKCAEEIMRNISDRRGYDLYSCDEDIINDIRSSISNIIAAHFA